MMGLLEEKQAGEQHIIQQVSVDLEIMLNKFVQFCSSGCAFDASRFRVNTLQSNHNSFPSLKSSHPEVFRPTMKSWHTCKKDTPNSSNSQSNNRHLHKAQSIVRTNRYILKC